MESSYFFFLVILLWLKILSHYRYYGIIKDGYVNKGLRDFLYDVVDNDESTSESLWIFLKITLPVFWKEFMDTDEGEYVLYRKITKVILWLWWSIAIIGGYFIWGIPSIT